MPDGWTLVQPAAKTDSADGWTLVSPRTVSAEDFAPERDRPIWQASTSLPGGTFAEKLKAAASVLGGEAVGFGKGALHSALNIAEMASNPVSTFSPEWRTPAIQAAERDTALSNDPAERFGSGLETAAEFAAPAMDVAKGGIALAKAAGPALRKAAPMAGSIATDIALHKFGVGPIATPIKIAVRALRSSAKNSGEILAGVKNPSSYEEWLAAEMAKKPADLLPAVEGRLVKDKAPSFEQMLADELASGEPAAAPAKVTLPPQPELRPGYTPRTTVPKPRPVAAPEPPAAAPAPAPVEAAPVEAPTVEEPPPQRAYFLKPQAVIDAEKAAKAEWAARHAAPKREITVADLPASWQSRIGQDLFPVTGQDGKELLGALRDEIKNSGLTVGKAIDAVSRNKALPTQVRAQLIRALSQTGAAR